MVVELQGPKMAGTATAAKWWAQLEALTLKPPLLLQVAHVLQEGCPSKHLDLRVGAGAPETEAARVCTSPGSLAAICTSSLASAAAPEGRQIPQVTSPPLTEWVRVRGQGPMDTLLASPISLPSTAVGTLVLWWGNPEGPPDTNGPQGLG